MSSRSCHYPYHYYPKLRSENSSETSLQYSNCTHKVLTSLLRCVIFIFTMYSHCSGWKYFSIYSQCTFNGKWQRILSLYGPILYISQFHGLVTISEIAFTSPISPLHSVSNIMNSWSKIKYLHRLLSYLLQLSMETLFNGFIAVVLSWNITTPSVQSNCPAARCKWLPRKSVTACRRHFDWTVMATGDFVYITVPTSPDCVTISILAQPSLEGNEHSKIYCITYSIGWVALLTAMKHTTGNISTLHCHGKFIIGPMATIRRKKRPCSDKCAFSKRIRVTLDTLCAHFQAHFQRSTQSPFPPLQNLFKIQ